jgi:hypothetical protein
MVRVLLSLLGVAVVGGACGDSPESATDPPDTEQASVVEVEVSGASHVLGDAAYPTSPPAGGDHFGAWQNCGFYTVPLRDEVAVHSLEHGAVWVTYRADTDATTLDAISSLTASESHLFASPYEDQETLLVLTAWARQLHVEAWTDPAVADFLDEYRGRKSPTAPEPGASCEGAIGVPPDDPLANYDEALAAFEAAG